MPTAVLDPRGVPTRRGPSFAPGRRRSRRPASIGGHVVRGTWIDLDERPAVLATDVWALLLARPVA